ncbi:hypothetical protein HMPREF9374_3358 [Desmospora sp. 8437]|uniref:Uncharacterized membrane protein YhhN n=1 Tax=Kroppenstedtia eburnea TaxID=714067 RepID=A0A1N7NUR3_9BACL|nr:hypothetical protein HMPREF9374_3358 [Desmospora sp. 8437]SIT01959.1 Uncharacterized membrane protein YhhN [Kroppenstedtia eburnea]
MDGIQVSKRTKEVIGVILFLSIATLVSGLAYLWLALYKDRQLWKFLLKPGTMIWIILLAVVGVAKEPGSYGWLILVGLLFSLVGDVFLMWPSNRFIQGLSSFFLAHLCYVAAFFPRMEDASGWVGFTLVLILLGAAYIYFLRPGVKEEGGGRLQFAVLSYVLVISLMVWTAWFTGSSLILAGALLFYLSDAILGWNRFVHPFPRGDLGVMSTYFTAQYLLALSVTV